MSLAAVPRHQLLFHVIDSCCSKVAAPVATCKGSEAGANVAFAATMVTIVALKLKLLLLLLLVMPLKVTGDVVKAGTVIVANSSWSVLMCVSCCSLCTTSAAASAVVASASASAASTAAYVVASAATAPVAILMLQLLQKIKLSSARFMHLATMGN
jgi:hypothetical protein